MEPELRPAFYAFRSGGWQDYLTLLHPPYTAWHLSYVVIGASLSPVVHWDRLAGLLLAFFLAVGLAAHALDEYRGRPLQTRIPERWLLLIAAGSLTGALAIGAVAAATISLWAVPFVAAGCFIVPAYNLEWFGGRFHSDTWFGLAWGAFPALVAYWANAQRLDLQAFLVAGACFALTLTQRVLSKRVRSLRRYSRSVTGQVEFQDGRVEAITASYLLATPEAGLKLTNLAIVLLALGLLASRL